MLQPEKVLGRQDFLPILERIAEEAISGNSFKKSNKIIVALSMNALVNDQLVD